MKNVVLKQDVRERQQPMHATIVPRLLPAAPVVTHHRGLGRFINRLDLCFARGARIWSIGEECVAFTNDSLDSLEECP